MRKFFALLAALSLLIVSLSGCNSISEANPATDFEYGFSEIYDGIFIKEYIGSDKTVVIPSKIDGQAVTMIAGDAFVGTSIESVVIPDSVNIVVARAFYGCDQLKTVDFGDGIIEIQEEAFRECTALESIILPKNLETIGEGAFYGCTSATEIYIPKTLTNWSGEYSHPTFYESTALETLTIEDGLSVLGEYGSFSWASSLKNLVIPASVKKIGDSVFHGATALESVTFLGDAPQVTENVFGYPNTVTASPNLVIYYDPNTSGWDDTVLSQYHLVSIYDKTE